MGLAVHRHGAPPAARRSTCPNWRRTSAPRRGEPQARRQDADNDRHPQPVLPCDLRDHLGAPIRLMTVAMVAFRRDGLRRQAGAPEDSLTAQADGHCQQGTGADAAAALSRGRLALVLASAGKASIRIHLVTTGNTVTGNAAVEVRGRSGNAGRARKRGLSAVDGRVLGVQGDRRTRRDDQPMRDLRPALRHLRRVLLRNRRYFLLGLAGALVLTGTLRYIESRRKRRSAGQPLKVRAMATATVGGAGFVPWPSR